MTVEQNNQSHCNWTEDSWEVFAESPSSFMMTRIEMMTIVEALNDRDEHRE